MPWLNVVSQMLLHSVRTSLPIAEIRASMGDLVEGDYTKLRTDAAEALDKLLDFETMPIIGDLAEHLQEQLATEAADVLVSVVSGHSLEAIRAHGRARVFAVEVIDSAEDAAAVLAHKPGGVWRLLHPHLVAAALAFGA